MQASFLCHRKPHGVRAVWRCSSVCAHSTTDGIQQPKQQVLLLILYDVARFTDLESNGWFCLLFEDRYWHEVIHCETGGFLTGDLLPLGALGQTFCLAHYRCIQEVAYVASVAEIVCFDGIAENTAALS